MPKISFLGPTVSSINSLQRYVYMYIYTHINRVLIVRISHWCKANWNFQNPSFSEVLQIIFSRTSKRYNETGNITDKRRSCRPRTICTPVNKKKVRQKLMRRPTLSLRKIAARTKISSASAWRIITNDLGNKSFKRVKTESLSDTVIEKRVQICRKLLDCSKLLILKDFFLRWKGVQHRRKVQL